MVQKIEYKTKNATEILRLTIIFSLHKYSNHSKRKIVFFEDFPIFFKLSEKLTTLQSVVSASQSVVSAVDKFKENLTSMSGESYLEPVQLTAARG